MTPPKAKVALVAGANGISGFGIVQYLTTRPESEWSKIVITSRRPPAEAFIDHRVTFVSADLSESPKDIDRKISPYASDVTHAFFTAYIHDPDFNRLKEKNNGLLENFIGALEIACPALESVVLQTGGKYYGAHLGKNSTPMEEDQPRYIDEYNFYFPQEDFLKSKSEKSGKWHWNVIRPGSVIGYTPSNSGMSEALGLPVYFLLCRELNQPAEYFGSEWLWNNVDTVSSVTGIAKMSVWAATNDHTRNEAFNYVNGDMFPRKLLWRALEKYYGLEPTVPKFKKTGIQETLTNNMDLLEWSKDKRPVWEKVVEKYGGELKTFDDCSWDFMVWAMGRAWPNYPSMNKARAHGWTHYEDSVKNFLDAIKSHENRGKLPARANLSTK